MEQLYYTSAARLADGQSGFGVLSRSAGVTEADARAAGMYNRYHRPDNLAAEADPASFPVSLSFYRGEGSRCYLTRSVYAREDYSGRRGNFFAHTLVMEDSELIGLSAAPILAFDARLWAAEAAETSVLPRLMDFPLVPPPSAAVALQFLRADEKRATLLPEILQALIECVSTHRRVLLVAPVPEVCGWIYTLSCCIPARLRPRLTFSTYQRDPQDVNVDIVGIDPSVEASTLFSTMQYRVFDCATGSGSEERVGIASGLLSYHLLNADEVSLSEIGALADSLELASWNELDSLVAVWMTTKSELGEVSVEIIDSAAQFLAARSGGQDGIAWGLALDAVGRLSGSGEPDVKHAVVRMASSVMVAAEQRQRLIGALAGAMSTALEIGTTDWLEVDAGEESEYSTLRAAATLTDLASWAPRMIQRADVRALHAVWWAFDAAACAKQDPGEQVWRDVAALACSEGDEELGISLLGTVQALSQNFPTFGRKIADIVIQPMVGCWPRDVADLAAALLFDASEAESSADADRLVWALERTPGRGTDVAELLVKLLEDPHKLRGFLLSSVRSSKIREGVGVSMSGVGGVEGTQLRRVLSAIPGCEVVRDLVVAQDMARRTPAEAIPLWIRDTDGRLTVDQLELARKMLDWLEGRRSSAADWEHLYALRHTVVGDEDIRVRCVAGFLSVRPLAPLIPIDAEDMRTAVASVRAEARPRLILMVILAHVSEAASKKRASWTSVFADHQYRVPQEVQEADYREFLVALTRLLEPFNLGRLVADDRERVVFHIYTTLCCSRYAPLCDRWFEAVLAEQKQESASIAGWLWACEIAQSTSDPSRLIGFLNGLSPAVSRRVRDDLRNSAADELNRMPTSMRQVFLQAAGEKKSFNLPFPRKKG